MGLVSDRSIDRELAPGWLVWTALWVVYLVWGSTYLAIRVTVETLPPLLTAGVRFILAGALMLGFLRLRRGPSVFRVQRRELLASTLVGTALLLGGNGMVSIAEQSVPSALTALIIASVPLWVVVWRYLVRERVPAGTLLGVLVGFAGVGILVLPGNRPSGASLGSMLLIVAASMSWATGSFFSSKLPLPRDPLTSTALQMLTGGAVMLVAGVGHGELSGLDPSSFSASSLWGLIYLVGAGSLLAFTAYVWLLQHAPISKVATYAYVNPVVAIILGRLILDEPVTASTVLGATIIIASVAWTVTMESRRARSANRANVEPGGAEPAASPPVARREPILEGEAG